MVSGGFDLRNKTKIMRRSKTDLYVHLIWATSRRRRVLTSEIEHVLHRCIQQEAARLGCVVLAINGMPDHVHLLAQLPATISVAKLAQSVKGVSSRLANQMALPEPFDWQDNYAAFTLSRSHLARVADYVQHQKEHHAQNTVWHEWEETDEESDIVSA